jgi:serine/threonine-protein kinase
LQRGEGLSRCIPYFEQAIAKDPHYALAHAGLADAYSTLGFYGFVPPQIAYSKARKAAEHAVELDGKLAEAHYSLGMCEWFFGWDLDIAASQFERAIELDQSMALAHVWLACTYVALGRFADSAAKAQRAQELEPISPIINAFAGTGYWFANRQVWAREAAHRALEIDPTLGLAHWVNGHADVAEAKYEDAVNAFENAALYTQRCPMILMYVGIAYALAGREADARWILGELQQKCEHGAVSPAYAYMVNLALGELDLAFEQLEQAFAERFPVLWILGVDTPGFESVVPRSDPRLASLLDRPELKWLERVPPRE